MRIEPHSDWDDKNGIIVKIESSFLHRDAFYVINFKYLNGEREHQSSVMPLAEFTEKYEKIKPKQKQVIVLETWLCAFKNDYYTSEATAGYFEGIETIKLLSTREIELWK